MLLRTGEGESFLWQQICKGTSQRLRNFRLTCVSSKDLPPLLVTRPGRACLGVLPAVVTSWHIVSGGFCSPFGKTFSPCGDVLISVSPPTRAKRVRR